MSFFPSCPAAAALILAASLSPAPLVGQQDSTMMSHDSMMAMPADTGMAMPHDSMLMMDHGNMMKHEDGMSFVGTGGHKAAGGYELTENTGGKRQLTLGNDFSIMPGSDLYLVLANGTTPDSKALWIGKLKQPAGAQTYDLPKGKDLTGYTTLLVYSKKTKQAVASADWHATSGKMVKHM